MKEVILTTAIHYSKKEIFLFLETLGSCFSGDLVIFTDRNYKLKEYDFKIILVDIRDPQFKEEQSASFNHVINQRHFWYLKFLKDNNHYNKVLLCDSRDVLFQNDPFKLVESDSLYVAMESKKVGDCKYNSSWIRMIYGDEILSTLQDNYISCAGTTMGSRNSILTYLEYMTKNLSALGKSLDTGSNTNILDQGIHNRYVNDHEDKVRKSGNNSNIFFTMGHADRFIFSRDGVLINPNSDAYSIVHQYDRFSWLCLHFKKKYKMYKAGGLNRRVGQMLNNPIKLGSAIRKLRNLLLIKN